MIAWQKVLQEALTVVLGREEVAKPLGHNEAMKPVEKKGSEES